MRGGGIVNENGPRRCRARLQLQLQVVGARISIHESIRSAWLQPITPCLLCKAFGWVRLAYAVPVFPAYASRSSWTKRDLIYVRYVRSWTSSTKPLSGLSTRAAKVCKAPYSLRKSDFRSAHATARESYPANIVRRAPLLATIWLHFEFSCTEYPYSFHVKVHLYLSYTETLPIWPLSTYQKNSILSFL